MNERRVLKKTLLFIMKLTYKDKVQIYELKNKDLATHIFQRCLVQISQIFIT